MFRRVFDIIVCYLKVPFAVYFWMDLYDSPTRGTLKRAIKIVCFNKHTCDYEGQPVCRTTYGLVHKKCKNEYCNMVHPVDSDYGDDI